MKTKSITVNGFVIARKYSWDEDVTFYVMPYEYDESDENGVRATVAPFSVTVTIPENINDVMVAGAVKGIKAQLEQMADEYHKKCAELKSRLAELQSISFDATVK